MRCLNDNITAHCTVDRSLFFGVKENLQSPNPTYHLTKGNPNDWKQELKNIATLYAKTKHQKQFHKS